MKILIADDSATKIAKLVQVLETRCLISRSDIVVAHCAQDARKMMSSSVFDLLILDIVLPLRSENTPETSTSIDLLDDIFEGNVSYRPAQIIGFTAYSDAAKEAGPSFADRLWVIVTYDESQTTWADQICNAVEYLRRISEQGVTPEYGTDLCILTALPDPELKAILRLPWNWEAPKPLDDASFFSKGSFKSSKRTYSVIAAHASRVGMVATAILATKIIHEFRPKYLVMAGVCAGSRDKTKLGDIIFGDPTWDWQSGKRVKDRENTKFSIASHQLDVPEFVRVRMHQFAGNAVFWTEVQQGWIDSTKSAPRLILGPIASGSAVLADGQVIEEIRVQHRHLVGVEMEAYGLYASAALAARPRPTAFALKSVCDFADPDKNDDMQNYASFTSAQAIEGFFSKYMDEIIDLAGT